MSEDDWDDEEENQDDDDLVTEVPCPSCGADVYEEAQRCPHCGEYIVHSTSPWTDRPRWWIVIGLLGIGAVIWASVRFF